MIYNICIIYLYMKYFMVYNKLYTKQVTYMDVVYYVVYTHHLHI